MSREPRIETARLVLRPPRAEDFDEWAAFMADPEAARFIGGPLSRPMAWRGFLTVAGAWAVQGFGMFSVLERDTGTWVGRLGPWMPEGWPGPEVGYGIVRSRWGRGYATEGAAAAIDWALRRAGLGRGHPLHRARQRRLDPGRRSGSGRAVAAPAGCPSRSTPRSRSGARPATSGGRGARDRRAGHGRGRARPRRRPAARSRSALERRGIAHEVVDWDDPSVDWGAFELAVVRSVWDYVRRRGGAPGLGRGGRRRDGPAAQPARDPALEQRQALPRRARPRRRPRRADGLRGAAARRWRGPRAEEVVVKPAVSAGSIDTERYPAGRRADAEAHVARLHAAGRHGDGPAVHGRGRGAGETARWSTSAARFSHAVRKGPMLVPGPRGRRRACS